MPDMNNLPTVVITGSTKGIGKGLAREFASRGHTVFVTGRNQEDVNAVCSEMADLPGSVVGVACEVTQQDQVQALWDAAAGAMGRVDIWINNAGLARNTRTILETSGQDVLVMITTNMLGTIFGSRVAAAGMIKQGSGKIFNMLGGGSKGEYFPGMGIYGTTKRGLGYFTDALTKELAKTPVLVGSIRPGMIVTEGVIREAKDNPQLFAASRAVMNRLVDQVETVAPYLVDQMLATQKTGQKIAWLSGGKIARRMLLGRFRKREDQFERHGL
jgi:NAD(P)-dependent dehydrogenase (short-subunit alcohol dehydrogenase family)